MTRDEAIKTLSILKAAYPNSYRNMTKDEANGTINIWASQFVNIPFAVVSIAINKLISTNTFPPTVSEVKDRIRGLHWEAWQIISDNKQFGAYDEKTVELAKQILEITERMRSTFRVEPSLAELLQTGNAYLPDSKARIE